MAHAGWIAHSFQKYAMLLCMVRVVIGTEWKKQKNHVVFFCTLLFSICTRFYLLDTFNILDISFELLT